METEVIMKRELFGNEISQRSKTGMFSATDLVKSGNKWRVVNGLPFFEMSDWLRQKGTKEYIEELESRYGKVKISGRGRGNHTWVHPLLFIDMALAISPKLKIEVYQWLYDSLLAYRNDSGDSYKRMCGCLFANSSNKSLVVDSIKVIASKIKIKCNVTDWQKANEPQLKLRDRMHDNIALLLTIMNNVDEAVRLGISHSLKN